MVLKSYMDFDLKQLLTLLTRIDDDGRRPVFVLSAIDRLQCSHTLLKNKVMNMREVVYEILN